MLFLKNLFQKSPIKKLLGGGLILSADGQKFYVDSNTHIGLKEKSVIIFRAISEKFSTTFFLTVSPPTGPTSHNKPSGRKLP
jgi:hypothetical protein